MFKFVIVAVLLGLVAAQEQLAQIRSFQNDASADGTSYGYQFETSNGISAQETGNAAGANGISQYVSPEGITIQLAYTADENGFHPQGNHLPTSPPIPEAIARALQYIATHPNIEDQQVLKRRF